MSAVHDPRREPRRCRCHLEHLSRRRRARRHLVFDPLRPNQPALGSHVANAAFMVSPTARGTGVGMRMGEHCLAEARRLGFRAMQFNFVVSTNEVAVRLWQRLGFEIIGTLPGAFRHARRGFVDAYVMFRTLQ